ncbi:hypothetical protein ACLOJK_012808 [Asimina triloba]
MRHVDGQASRAGPWMHLQGPSNSVVVQTASYTESGREFARVSVIPSLGILTSDSLIWNFHVGTSVVQSSREDWRPTRLTLDTSAPLRITLLRFYPRRINKESGTWSRAIHGQVVFGSVIRRETGKKFEKYTTDGEHHCARGCHEAGESLSSTADGVLYGMTWQGIRHEIWYRRCRKRGKTRRHDRLGTVIPSKESPSRHQSLAWRLERFLRTRSLAPVADSGELATRFSYTCPCEHGTREQLLISRGQTVSPQDYRSFSEELGVGFPFFRRSGLRWMCDRGRPSNSP